MGVDLFDKETEDALLAACVFRPDIYHTAANHCTANDFSDIVNSSIFKAIRELHANGVHPEPVTIRDTAAAMMAVSPMYHDPDELIMDRIAALKKVRFSPDNIERYARKVRRLSGLRMIENTLQGALSEVTSDGRPEELASRAMETLLKVANPVEGRNLFHYSELRQRYIETLKAETAYLNDHGSMPGIRFDFNPVDEYTHGLRAEDLMILAGEPGCITGDAIIHTNRAGKGRKMRLDHIYHQFNGLVCECDGCAKARKSGGGKPWNLSIPTKVRALVNGELRQHLVKGVYDKGDRPCCLLEFESGRTLKCTWDHRILTENRGWVEAQNLTTEDQVVANGRFMDKEGYVWLSGADRFRNHPKAKDGRYYREHVHIMEEHLGRLLEKGEVVHHINGIRDDNRLENLQVMTASEHGKLHGQFTGDRKKFHGKIGKHGQIMFVTCVDKLNSRTDIGIQRVYDIEMDAPHHNFVANGIVVHNSGKTSVSMALIRKLGMKAAIQKENEQEVHGSLFVSLEMGEDATAMRWSQMIGSMTSRELRGGMSYPRINELDNRWESEEEIPVWTLFAAGMKADQLKARIAFMVKKYGIKLVVIDHFRRIRMDGRLNGNELDEARIQYLKSEICKGLGVSVIVIAHTNKSAASRDDKKPRMSDLSGSQMVAAEADYIVFVHRPYEHLTDSEKVDGSCPWEPSDAYLVWRKNRNDRAGDARFIFDGSTMRIDDPLSMGKPSSPPNPVSFQNYSQTEEIF